MNDRVRIEEHAPYARVGGESVPLRPGQTVEEGHHVLPFYDARIRIDVRPLEGAELGALRSTGQEFSRHVHRAVERKNEEDLATYGLTTQQIRERSVEMGYFGSPAHTAWSEAAEARSGGKLTAGWWRAFDPLGGTNGHGPEIVAGGMYPHSFSRIGMAHDTDWSLGRHFQAGPLRELYGVGFDAKTRGEFGVVPNNPINRREDIYTNGHPDWDVRFFQLGRRRAEGGDPEVRVQNAAVPSHTTLEGAARDGLGRLDSARLGLTEPGQAERLAAALAAQAQREGLTAIDSVVPSRDHQRLFAVQGAPDDPAARRVSVETVLGAQQSLELSARIARESTVAVEPVAQEIRARGLA